MSDINDWYNAGLSIRKCYNNDLSNQKSKKFRPRRGNINVLILQLSEINTRIQDNQLFLQKLMTFCMNVPGSAIPNITTDDPEFINKTSALLLGMSKTSDK